MTDDSRGFGGHALRTSQALGFVTVVFDAEYELLLLQARSFDKWVARPLAAEISVIDNTVFGLRGRRRRRLEKAYGRHADKLTIVRTTDLEVDRRADGWRSQQAAKLLISRRIHASLYVILDAKNHFIREVTREDFASPLDVPHGGRHSYLEHPLRQSLVHTLTMLGANSVQIAEAERSFPVTATPFVMDTGAVRACVDDLEKRSGFPFAAAFEQKRLLEFFYYSGWMTLHRPETKISDGMPIQTPIIWGADPSLTAVERALALVVEHDAPAIGVHRRVLARAPRDARRALEEFWVERSLLSASEARALLRRFRLAYGPAMALTRGAERLRRWKG